MKLLKIVAEGLPLFQNKCEICFLAQQRVTENDAEDMSCLFSTSSRIFYQNNVLSFIGINASGKTSILKLISFVCGMLSNQSLNTIKHNEVIDSVEPSGKIILETYFSTGVQIHLLTTTIEKKSDRFVITEETLKSKASHKVSSKKNIFDFDNPDESIKRDNNEEYLLDDVSIMVAFNKKHKENLVYEDMLKYTNTNELSVTEDCPAELIAFFDPSIEYLRVRQESRATEIHLKFYGKKEIELHRFSELNRYLSSGTIKGINVFLSAINVFQTGGYLIIDELENHFNHEIISTLIRFYMDKKINPKGAMLIFSTHYAEILDEFDRNDNIYLVKNKNGILTKNLYEILTRNDIKKSDAYQSGFLGGTVPAYESYMDLKNSLIVSERRKNDET